MHHGGNLNSKVYLKPNNLPYISLPDDATDFDEAIVFQIAALDKNLDRMFDLITELFTSKLVIKVKNFNVIIHY